MSAATPISDAELVGLFVGLERTPLALAVSGGADSMALMHMVARWAVRDIVKAAYREAWEGDPDAPTRTRPSAPPPRPAWSDDSWTIDDLRRAGGPPHVMVLTVDHGLRAEASDEARLVCEEAGKLGLPCRILCWDSEKPTSGIQEAAREARRRLMSQAVLDEACAIDDLHRGRDYDLGGFPMRHVVMAHTQEDQAETFLMRLARGSGLEGLGGMRELDYIRGRATDGRPQGFDVTVRRPLLDMPKARLVATLKAYDARWVEDPSNEDDRFERVRVRKALAQLGELGLSAEKVALSARRLRDVEIDFRMVMDAEQLVEWRPAFWHGGLMSEFEIDTRNPFFCGSYVTMRTLRQILRGHGGSARDVELAQLEKLVLSIGEGGPRGITLAGCKIDLLDGQGRRLRVYREGSGEGLPVIPIAPGQSVDWDGRRFEVSASAHAPIGAVVRALGLQGWADLKKAVPEIAHLKWPAAAAATLPVVEVAGAIVAYPGVSSVMDSVQGLPSTVRTAWTAFCNERETSLRAVFGYAGW